MLTVREKTKMMMKRTSNVRRIIPWIFLGIYGLVWASFTYSLRGVLDGTEYLEDTMVYSPSQVTAYLMILFLGIFIFMAFMIVRKAVTPDRTMRWRVTVLERKVEEMERRLKDERDNGDSDRGSDAGEGVEN